MTEALPHALAESVPDHMAPIAYEHDGVSYATLDAYVAARDAQVAADAPPQFVLGYYEDGSVIPWPSEMAAAVNDKRVEDALGVVVVDEPAKAAPKVVPFDDEIAVDH